MGYFNFGTMLNNDNKGIIERDKDYNQRLRYVLVERIRNLMFSIFEYENLPENTPRNIIERLLFDYGELVAWDVGGKVYFSNAYAHSGELDVYNRPISIKPHYMNGKQSTWKRVNKNAVIMRNNATATSTMAIIEPFIYKLTLSQEAILDGLKSSMTKWALKINGVDKKDRDAMQQAMRYMLNNNGKLAILNNDIGFDIEKLPFYEEFKASEYWQDFNNTFNLMYQLLGIKGNTNEDKKERLIVDEVNVYEERTNLLMLSLILERQHAIDKINELFNTNIKLVINVDRNENDVEDDYNDDNSNDY